MYVRKSFNVSTFYTMKLSVDSFDVFSMYTSLFSGTSVIFSMTSFKLSVFDSTCTRSIPKMHPNRSSNLNVFGTSLSLFYGLERLFRSSRWLIGSPSWYVSALVLPMNLTLFFYLFALRVGSS